MWEGAPPTTRREVLNAPRATFYFDTFVETRQKPVKTSSVAPKLGISCGEVLPWPAGADLPVPASFCPRTSTLSLSVLPIADLTLILSTVHALHAALAWEVAGGQ
jgi:hypothetical protein